MKAGTLYVVSTPIGNPEDLTLRTLRVFREVSLIAAEDPRTTHAFLAPHQIATPLTSYHNDNKEEKTPILLTRLREGQSIALVCDAGTPTVEDPGCYLIARAIRDGIRVSPVPGASVPLAVLVTTGWPGDRFTVAGTWPVRRMAQRRLLTELADSPYPVIVFVDAQRLTSTLDTLAKRIGDRPSVLGIDLTMPAEHVYRGTIRRLLARHRKTPFHGELVLVIRGVRQRKELRKHVGS
jgi:16S rRNA (cytidine1402-2'-O)-methyltransferase